MFELVENRLCAYADNFKLPSVVLKPLVGRAVSGSLNRDLARNQEYCNRWYTILKSNETKALVVSRFRRLELV